MVSGRGVEWEGGVTYRRVEDTCKDEEEDGADEVDDGDGDVEAVRLLVHVGSKNAHGDQEDGLDDDQRDGLQGAAALGQGDEHALEEDVDEHGDDEVVGRRLELDVEEAPLVEGDRVGVEDVGRVLVHGDAAARQADDLARGPGEDGEHGEDGEDGQDHFRARVVARELPEAEHHHLREADEDDAEEDAFQDRGPAVAEVLELVALHPAHADQAFAAELEQQHPQHHEDDEDEEEDVAGQENVGHLDTTSEPHALDPPDDHGVGGIGPRGTATVATANNLTVKLLRGSSNQSVDVLQAALLDLHGRGRQAGQSGGGSAARGSLIPSRDLLNEADANDPHTPLEVLRPRGGDGREWNGGHADEGLRLEESEQSHRVRGHVRGRVRVAEPGGDGRRHERQA